jgi:hypothetical protein
VRRLTHCRSIMGAVDLPLSLSIEKDGQAHRLS